MVATRRGKGAQEATPQAAGEEDNAATTAAGRRRSRRLSETPLPPAALLAAAAVDSPSRAATPTRRNRKVSELQSETEAPVSASPTRKSRRLSETVEQSATDSPASVLTPAAGRSNKLTELSAADSRDSPARKGRRLSGQNLLLPQQLLAVAGVTDSPAAPDSRPGTPTRSGRVRKISELSDSGRPATPTRKSRRLSGAGLPTGEDETAEIGGIVSVSAGEAPVNPRLAELEAAGGLALLRGGSPRTANRRRVSGTFDIPSRIAEVPEDVASPEKQQPQLAPVPEDAGEEVPASPCKGSPIVPKVTLTPPPVAASNKKPVEVNKVIEDNKENSGTDVKESVAATVVDPLERLAQLMYQPIPRQKPKSGRFWKAERSQFRQIRRDKGNKKTFEQRLKLKDEAQRSKQLAESLIRAKIEKRQELQRRIEENKKRKEEKERKSEVYQIVSNPNKIKKMKKKDLAKRDILGKVQK